MTKGQTPWNKGKTGVYSKETLMRMSEARKGILNLKNRDENNGQWKGDNVGIIQLHAWVKQHLPKPDLCQICNLVPPYDLANISPKYNPDTYNRELKNWFWRCRKCHMVSDDRIYNLMYYRKNHDDEERS